MFHRSVSALCTDCGCLSVASTSIINCKNFHQYAYNSIDGQRNAEHCAAECDRTYKEMCGMGRLKCHCTGNVRMRNNGMCAFGKCVHKTWFKCIKHNFVWFWVHCKFPRWISINTKMISSNVTSDLDCKRMGKVLMVHIFGVHAERTI